MEINIALCVLFSVAIFTLLSDGMEGKSITNCRKQFRGLQKRSEDVLFLEGYDIVPENEERVNGCKVYDIIPIPHGPRPRPPFPGSVTKPPENTEQGPVMPPGAARGMAYYVYPMVVDVVGKRIYSAVKLPDLSRANQATQIRFPDPNRTNQGTQIQVYPLPGGHTQAGKETQQGTNLDPRFIQSLFRKGNGSYAPPVVIVGKPRDPRWLPTATNSSIVRHGYFRPVKKARVGKVVRLPNSAAFWKHLRHSQRGSATLATATKRWPANVKPASVKPARVKPASVKPARVKPARVKPAKVKPAKVNPAKVKPQTSGSEPAELQDCGPSLVSASQSIPLRKLLIPRY